MSEHVELLNSLRRASTLHQRYEVSDNKYFNFNSVLTSEPYCNTTACTIIELSYAAFM